MLYHSATEAIPPKAQLVHYKPHTRNGKPNSEFRGRPGGTSMACTGPHFACAAMNNEVVEAL